MQTPSVSLSDFQLRARTPEEITVGFRNELLELRMSANELAARMTSLGDTRDHSALLKSIQRMISGETRVSGEMQAIMGSIKRENSRARNMVEKAHWITDGHNNVTTQYGQFSIALEPQTKGRWRVNVFYQTKFSWPWPAWQNSLDEAKVMAFVCIEDAMDKWKVS